MVLDLSFWLALPVHRRFVGKDDATIYPGFSFPLAVFEPGGVNIPSVAAARAAMNSWTAYSGGVPNSE